MRDLKDQIRTYYETTTVPVDVDAITVNEDTVIVGLFPDAVRRRSAMKTAPPAPQPTKGWKGPRLALTAFAVTAIVFVAAFAAVRLVDPDSSVLDGGGSPDPAEVIETYTEAYNRGDIDDVMALFTEESVMIGHPFNANAAEGAASIRTIQTMDIAAATPVDAYTISNVEVTGNTVTWDHVWTRLDGEVSCAEGHTAVVEGGKILSWTWATKPYGCP